MRGIGGAVRGLIAGLGSLPEDRRPALLVDAAAPVPRGFQEVAVRLPRWPLARLDVPDPWPGLLGGRAVRRAGARVFHATQPGLVPTDLPVVVTCYDLVPLRFPALYLAGPRRAAQRRAYGRYLGRLREARLVLVPTDATARDVTRLAGVDPGRVRLVPLGAVPPPAGAEVDGIPASEAGASPGRAMRQSGGGSGDGAPYVLYAGSLEPHKNADVLVDAARMLPAGLQVVMTGPWSRRRRERLGRRVARTGVADRVRLRGYVGASELSGLRAGAVAVAVPSRVEGWGFPALEAMAAGTPAVVSDAESLVEVTAGACPVVPCDDSRAWADVLGALLADEEARQRWVARGRARVAELTWERCAEVTVAAHAEALDG